MSINVTKVIIMEAIELSAKNAAIRVRNSRALAAYKLTKAMSNKKSEKFILVLNNGLTFYPATKKRFDLLKAKYLGQIKQMVTL